MDLLEASDDGVVDERIKVERGREEGEEAECEGQGVLKGDGGGED